MLLLQLILSALKKCYFSLYANLGHSLQKDLLQGASKKMMANLRSEKCGKMDVGGKQHYQTFAINLA